MKTFISSLCAAALALTTLTVPIASASAAPFGVPQYDAGKSDVVDVQSRRDRRERFERRGDDAYYNGRRGYRTKRPGYRYHNGFWFPGGAFIAGAVIGGAIASQPPRVVVRRGGNAHVDWCSNRYRSYRAFDNTYQPTNGPRRQCVSPYS